MLDCTIVRHERVAVRFGAPPSGSCRLPVVIISDTPEVAEESLRSRKARRVLLVPKPFTGAQVAKGSGAASGIKMPLWSMDEWQYLEREVVTDPKGRQWTVALMDVLGQEGDPDMPNKLLELQYSSGRYFTLIYSAAERCSGNAATPLCQKRRTLMEICWWL